MISSLQYCLLGSIDVDLIGSFKLLQQLFSIMFYVDCSQSYFHLCCLNFLNLSNISKKLYPVSLRLLDKTDGHFLHNQCIKGREIGSSVVMVSLLLSIYFTFPYYIDSFLQNPCLVAFLALETLVKVYFFVSIEFYQQFCFLSW